MQPFTQLTGTAIPFPLPNIDTDVIIPARFLKAVSRKGMGSGAFSAVRFAQDGTEIADSVFNQARYQGAPILLAGDNFGCGSSREHAAWALLDLGIRCVIAPSFSDIFSGNAFKNGILTVVLPQAQVDALVAAAEQGAITVDLENQVVTSETQLRFPFSLDPFRRHCLLNGLDEIGLTLQSGSAIDAYEQQLALGRPWLLGKAGPHWQGA
jgi:3-isopropylmalate/(R)-2-methylmalate dehydratase small subunit